jgi:hypothetical protein
MYAMIICSLVLQSQDNFDVMLSDLGGRGRGWLDCVLENSRCSIHHH